MLDPSTLKSLLNKSDISVRDKLLIVLASFDAPAQVKDLRERASGAGYRVNKKTNISAQLSATKGLAIRLPEGWELSSDGITHLNEIGVPLRASAAVMVATDLRTALAGIAKVSTRAFVEEAVECLEHGLHRSAIVMSWLAAIDVLHYHVHQNHLHAFNSEVSRVKADWKPAKTTDDFGRLKESEFLDRICAISVIGKNVKKELQECLDRRNGCGHPNSLKIGPNTVAHHIEILVNNVFQVF